jgi:hypothetical protein
MKYYIVSLLLLLVLAACGPSAQTPTPDAGQPARSTPTSDPSLVNPNTGGQTNQTGYPPPPPTLTPFPEGYPVPPTIEPVNPYPAAVDSEAVWVLHPLGQQCADTSTYTYANVQEARAGLTAAGITVYDMTTVELMVCQACECPTSTHYRAQIAAADRQKATALGWQEE